MDWASVICAGLGGAIGGGIGALVARKIPDSKRNLKVLAIVPLVVILAKVVPETPLKAALDNALFKKSRFARAAQEFADDLQNDQNVFAKIQGLPASERAAAGRKLGQEGLYWLSLKELDQWNGLRLE